VASVAVVVVEAAVLHLEAALEASMSKK